MKITIFWLWFCSFCSGMFLTIAIIFSGLGENILSLASLVLTVTTTLLALKCMKEVRDRLEV